MVAKHPLGVTARVSYSRFLSHLNRVGWKRVSLPKGAEQLDDFSSYIAPKKVSNTLGIRQAKYHHLSEVSWGKQ